VLIKSSEQQNQNSSYDLCRQDGELLCK